MPRSIRMTDIGYYHLIDRGAGNNHVDKVIVTTARKLAVPLITADIKNHLLAFIHYSKHAV